MLSKVVYGFLSEVISILSFKIQVFTGCQILRKRRKNMVVDKSCRALSARSDLYFKNLGTTAAAHYLFSFRCPAKALHHRAPKARVFFSFRDTWVIVVKIRN